jgi:hypothetical protein
MKRKPDTMPVRIKKYRLAELRAIAAKEYRTIASLIQEAVDQFLAKRKGKK